jgi:hypothetical protein
MTALLTLSCALLTGALSGTAQAEEAKPTRFSLGLGVGIRPDMAQLGTTIVQDGTVDVADSSLAGYYSTDKFLMSDRNNMTLQANSEGTSSIFNMQSDYQAGGSMLGLEKGGDLRYELDDVIKFPLFISAGFYHTGKLSGGEQSRTMGDVVPNLPDLYINVIENITGNSAEDYAGGTMKTTWNASWWEIPISLGMKVPIKPHWFVYGKAGVSIFNGGFDITVDIDEKYANVLGTHVDAAALEGADLSPDGGVQDTISFRTGAVGLNYGLGTQVNIRKRFAVYFELNASGAAKTVYGSETKDETKQLFTALSSDLIAGGSGEEGDATYIQGDSTWFDQLAYPVVMQGASGRFGMRVYFF